ncbi:hypothetical protein [Chryseobacterium cucumeris]|uniref:restriction endonuclease n=1 Tax=Chryseobacterium cucumeris TaxID=1813611 RepID=UPI0023EFF662|nr:hypothetical protein [Chryseobacterium cucumeris]
MKALKSLPKPQNWQDFETLCKKLWGEIWECHEIKKNGRQGQVQNGVDVYGKPNGESGYYGIQCKGKDEYTGKNFTKKEIDKEIEKAKSFIPKLKKLYFATTAEKDARIEEYIREINLKNIENGIFEVEIYCWGDIVELIFENRNTYNYYVKSLNFKDNYSVELNFFNNSETLDLFPKFKKETIIKVGKTYKQYNPRKRTLDLLGASFNSRTEKVNVSLNQIRLKLRNSGERDIINFKIIIEIDGEITDIVENNMNLNIKKINSQSNIIINKEEKRIEIIPSKKILVGDDEYLPEEFYIKTPPYRTSLKLNWKLLSSNFVIATTLSDS